MLNNKGEIIQPCRTPFCILTSGDSPSVSRITAFWFQYRLAIRRTSFPSRPREFRQLINFCLAHRRWRRDLGIQMASVRRPSVVRPSVVRPSVRRPSQMLWCITSHKLLGLQPNLGQRCTRGTLMLWCRRRSHVKVKGHLRSYVKVYMQDSLMMHNFPQVAWITT